MKKAAKGFGVIEIILVVAVVGLAVAVTWLYIDRQHNKSTQNSSSTIQQTTSKEPSNKPKLQTHTIDNEQLSFDYNPTKTTVTTDPVETSGGMYLLRTNASTGNVKMTITTGITGIGGVDPCEANGGADCRIIDSKDSKVLGKSAVFNLYEMRQKDECGHGNLPSCDKAPIVKSYMVRAVSGSTDALGWNAKNTNGKARQAGLVLISIEAAAAISNQSLLKNSEVLDTISIIESMRY